MNDIIQKLYETLGSFTEYLYGDNNVCKEFYHLQLLKSC
jgi:hypothetical protein